MKRIQLRLREKAGFITGAVCVGKFAAIPILVACFAAIAPPAGAQTPHTHEHSFSGAAQWASVFDDPARDAWQKPHEVIGSLGLRPDAVVADLGAGTGYFSVRLAHMVPGGKVFAVDTEPDMVKYLAERAAKSGLTNLVAVQGMPTGPNLPEKVDLVLLVDVFHHIDDRVRYFRDLRASLNAGGRIAIIDFRADSPIGPPVPARLAPAQVISEMTQAGYVLDKTPDFLPNQYFVIFR